MTGSSIKPDWPAPPHVRAVSTERLGGVSVGVYRSFNLGSRVGDTERFVAENRRRLARAERLPAEPTWLNQVHGRSVARLGSMSASDAADAAVTSAVGTVCVVLTADCLPVLLTSRDGSVVAAAHAGWRGLADGILANTIDALSCEPEQLLAWLGPGISADAYEVGDEVRSAFVERNAATASAFARNARGRWQADLYMLARQALAERGVVDVYGGGFCTYNEDGRFFSHRREAPCGRMATLIWKTK